MFSTIIYCKSLRVAIVTCCDNNVNNVKLVLGEGLKLFMNHACDREQDVITPRACARGKVIGRVVVVVVSTKIAISRDTGV